MKLLVVGFLCNLLILVRGTPSAVCSKACSGPTGSRIVGGKNAIEGQFPYQVQLIDSFTSKHVCGASIIHKRWVLTAAHCVERFSPYRLAIVVGSIKRLGGNGKRYRAESFAVHENYTTKPGAVGPDNDIALIRLTRDIAFDKNVQKVKLLEDTTNDKLTNATVTLSGWGTVRISGRIPDILQYIDLKVLDHRSCNETWLAFINQEIAESKICTTSRVAEGPCHGDSGGPLVVNGTQVGVVSYGWPCATGVPDVFTRVSSHIGFIKDTISSFDPDFI